MKDAVAMDTIGEGSNSTKADLSGESADDNVCNCAVSMMAENCLIWFHFYIPNNIGRTMLAVWLVRAQRRQRHAVERRNQNPKRAESESTKTRPVNCLRPRLNSRNAMTNYWGKTDAVILTFFIKHRSYVKEDHGQPIFGTQFNQYLKKDQPLLFASTGSNRVSIYECLTDGGLKMIQCYMDPDVSEQRNLYFNSITFFSPH